MARIQHSRMIISLATFLILCLTLLGWRHRETISKKTVKLTGKPLSRPHRKPDKKPDRKPYQKGAVANVLSEYANKEKLAYVTWLSATEMEENDRDNLDTDVYFTATRMLVYQLLHAPKTRTNGIDVIVVVTPDVSESRVDRLKRDGATVRHIDFLHGENDGWIQPENDRWKDVMSKLRVWEMVEYSRILFLDADMILNRPLDGVFDDPGAKVVHEVDSVDRHEDEIGLPSTYLLAAVAEVEGFEHAYPPTWDHGLKKYGLFNAGFFMLKPSLELFRYYKSLLDKEGRFDPIYPEQNLLNHVHRWNGPMPWKELSTTWNIKEVNENDMNEGVASMHEKWWMTPVCESKKLMDYFISIRWQMDGYYQAVDEARELKYNCSQWSTAV